MDANNPDVGSTITAAEFSSLPYQASSCGHEVSPAEAQLDRLGVFRNIDVTTAFGLAPLLLVGTNRIALIHERLARTLSAQASLRLLEPPMMLEPIHQLMIWPTRLDTDPGHQWLRSRLTQFAAYLESTHTRQTEFGKVVSPV